jgi:hypothetical protein
MSWIISVTNTSDLASDGLVTLSFDLFLDGEVKAKLQVNGAPELIRDMVSKEAERFISIYESYKAEGVVPQVDEEIVLSL